MSQFAESESGAVESHQHSMVRRYVPIILMICSGVAVQLWLSDSILGFVGLLMIIIGYAMFYGHIWSADDAFDFVPIISKSRRWATVTPLEIERLQKKISAISSVRGGCITRVAGCSGTLIFTTAVMALGVNLLFAFGGRSEEYYFIVLLYNLVVLAIFNTWVFAPTFWEPALVKFKLPMLEKIIKDLPHVRLSRWEVRYQIELTGSNKGEIPSDIRVILRPPDCPKEFYGLQIQISVNQGGPYLYFIVTAAPKTEIAKPETSEKDLLEPKDTEEASVLVIRQFTDKTTGFITTDSDTRRLLLLATRAATRTVKRIKMCRLLPQADKQTPEQAASNEA